MRYDFIVAQGVPVLESFQCGEEPTVTLQIALRGSDGWVFASDRKTIGIKGIRVGSVVTKVQADLKRQIIWMTWGDSISDFAVDALVEQVDQGVQLPINDETEMRAFFHDFGNKVWEQALKDLASNPDPPDPNPYRRGAFVFFIQQPHWGWSWCIGQTSHADKAVGTYCGLGDTSSTALFLAERYVTARYPPTLWSVSALTNLAAHIICNGAILNSGGVEGLDIITYKLGNVEILDETEIEILRKRSADLDKAIGDLFLS
jgi:hypothetical protein